MSAAEHADPGPDQPGPATVLSFPTAIRPSRRTARRERTAVPPQPNPNLSPQERLTAWVEQAFKKHRRTLTDPDTAEAFLIAAGVMRHVVDGALAQGLIDEGAHQELNGMLTGLEAAPGLLAPE